MTQVALHEEKIMDIEKKRVLLVDDEEVVLFGYSMVLSEPWLTLDTAECATKAKKLLSENKYNAAILDLRLSSSTKLEGLDLIVEVKKTQENCRILVLTAYSDDITKRRALDLGAEYFLEKPVDPERLKKMLAEGKL